MAWDEVKNSGIGNFPALVRDRMQVRDATFIRGDDGRDFTYDDYWSLSGRIAPSERTTAASCSMSFASALASVASTPTASPLRMARAPFLLALAVKVAPTAAS